MPKRFSRGWLLAWTIACVNALPAKQGRREASSYGLTSNIGDLLAAAATDYDFEDFVPEKYAEKVEEASLELPDLNGASTTTSTTVRSNYVVLPGLLEPDAEMLPAHYTGVKPPGVDHMEITMMDSASLGSNRKDSLAGGAKSMGFRNSAGGAAASAGAASSGVKGEKGFSSKASFEKGFKGERLKENHKGSYEDAAGKKKSHEDEEKHFKGHKDESSGSKGASFEVDGHREKGHNAAGYHNVYHKDEYKKDADFYDNDHQGMRFHKHGRYNEKHAAAEGDFRKGGSHDSAFAEVEAAKNGLFEKGQSSDDSSGHIGKSGYDGFFGKLDEFAKKVGGVAGQAYASAGKV